MNKNDLLVSGAVIFKKGNRDKIDWLLVKQNEGSDWEIAKVSVRKTESSVRAALRMASEQGGMSTKVLEEVGRSSATSQINSKNVTKKIIYYLMILKAEGENLGFFDIGWFDYAKVRRTVSTKKEKNMFGNARKELQIWQKKQKAK